MPVGNAGNITAYWRGYREYHADGLIDALPVMRGYQAAGAAPIVRATRSRSRRRSPPRSASATRRRGSRRSRRRGVGTGRSGRSPTARSWPPSALARHGVFARWRRRVGRRAAAAARGRRARAGPDGRVRADRPRAEGPGVGHRRREEPVTIPAELEAAVPPRRRGVDRVAIVEAALDETIARRPADHRRWHRSGRAAGRRAPLTAAEAVAAVRGPGHLAGARRRRPRAEGAAARASTRSAPPGTRTTSCSAR
jgi:hypothetical protein